MLKRFAKRNNWFIVLGVVFGADSGIVIIDEKQYDQGIEYEQMGAIHWRMKKYKELGVRRVDDKEEEEEEVLIGALIHDNGSQNCP